MINVGVIIRCSRCNGFDDTVETKVVTSGRYLLITITNDEMTAQTGATFLPEKVVTEDGTTFSTIKKVLCVDCRKALDKINEDFRSARRKMRAAAEKRRTALEKTVAAAEKALEKMEAAYEKRHKAFNKKEEMVMKRYWGTTESDTQFNVADDELYG